MLVNTSFFFIFSEILRFFKEEATFSYSGKTFFKKSFIRLVESDCLSNGNSVSWSELFFCESKPLLELGEKQYPKKELIIASGQLIFWLVKTLIFCIFLRVLARKDFFSV